MDRSRPSALDAALWLARHRHDLLTNSEGEAYRSWRAGLEPATAEILAQLSAGLLRAWIDRVNTQIGGPARDDDWQQLAVAGIGLLRRRMLTPYDLHDAPLLAECLDPDFKSGSLPRIMRGINNCDGINLLFAELMATWTEVDLVTISGHRVVALRPSERDEPRVFVDAFSELRPFTLDGHEGWGLPSLATIHAEVRQRNAARSRRGVSLGEQPAERRSYERARLRLEVEAPARVGLPELSELEPSLAHPDPPDPLERRYYEARAHHLFGDPEAARRAYLEVAWDRSAPGGGYRETLREAARVFAHRLADVEGSTCVGR